MTNEKTLLMEIFQPFAQYRNPFTFYYAQTYPLPPKSTIIGMLQNAVGDWYGNKYGIERWWSLKVSVHAGFESVFWSYQSLIKGELDLTEDGVLINRHNKNPGGNVWLPLYVEGLTSQRSPVYQQELFNGHLSLFIRGENEIIDEIKSALEKLNKSLFLGRSEDIIFIRKVTRIEPDRKIDDVKGDLKLNYPTYLSDKIPIKNKKYPIYYIPVKVIFKNNNENVKHKSEITKSTKRETFFQQVIYTGYDYSIILDENTSVDLEVYKINENKEIRVVSPYGWL
ncbi:MAG: type I-B CRISPR-associated protein Cas5b [Candidatus Thermoplasmatota archaeon]